MYRTIYYKDTGKLIISRRMSDDMVAERLTQYTDQACLNVACTEIDKYQVNLDTLQLEEIPVVDDSQHWLRVRRNTELKMCDWTQAADSPLSDTKKTEWATYRQQLRDLPVSYPSITSRDEITWPTKPE
jgi:hypothetical protein